MESVCATTLAPDVEAQPLNAFETTGQSPGRSFTITRKNGDQFTVSVDAEDYDRVVAAGPWHVLGESVRRWGLAYVRRNSGNGRPYHGSRFLHRFILNGPVGMEIDHADGNPLNNRRSNLRLVTHQQNGQNVRPRRNNTSGFRGMYWHKENRLWCGRVRGIDANGKDVSLWHCYFTDLHEAARETQAARLRLLPFSNEVRHPVAS